MIESLRSHHEMITASVSSHLEQSPQVEQVVSYTIPWPETSLLTFLSQGFDLPRVYWESRQSQLGLAGCGVAARLTASGPARFQILQQDAAALFNSLVCLNPELPAGVGPRLLGGFSFSETHQAEGIWSAFPAAQFILPRYQLTRLNEQFWLTVNYCLGPEDDPVSLPYLLDREIRQLEGMADLTLARRHQRGPADLASPEAALHTQELTDPATWNNAVTESTRRIRRGELDKVVLARARQICSPRPLDPVEVLRQLEQAYPDCYRFLFEPVPGHAFYGATPELLVEMRGATLYTVAMAGSIRRGKTAEEDDALGEELLANPKERIEHALVVEAIEENLRPLVAQLQLPSQPELCRLSNIQHLKTPIQGRLLEKQDILSVVEVMHPTPAVGGRPRDIALGMIPQLEPTTRGWYAGPLGWLDQQGNGMFSVSIRSAVTVGSESLLFAGAGIVADSIPEKEWRETQLKFRPLQEALSQAVLP